MAKKQIRFILKNKLLEKQEEITCLRWLIYAAKKFQFTVKKN